MDWAASNKVKVFTRERAITKFSAESQALQRVCGVTDYILWQLKEQQWEDVAITSVKKIVTGNGRAQKPTVAKYLTAYLGKHPYHCNDETDAVAVGLAW